MKEFWDKKFSDQEFIYGTSPNQFFKNELAKLEKGRMISFGEGEGRNAVYAAKLGWEVDAVDYSVSGKNKAESLAQLNSVGINYIVSDVITYQPNKDYYDLAIVIFLHVPGENKIKMFANIIDSLKPGGKVILEVFEKDQLKFSSGGPKQSDLLYSLDEIAEGFIDLTFLSLSKEVVILNEGTHHSGEGVVIRFVGERV